MSGNKEYVDGNEGVVMVVEEAAGSGTDVMWFEPSVVLKDVKSSVWVFFKFKGTLVNGPNKAKVYCSLCVTNKKASAEVSQHWVCS
jgi:hypothetical protein